MAWLKFGQRLDCGRQRFRTVYHMSCQSESDCGISRISLPGKYSHQLRRYSVRIESIQLLQAVDYLVQLSDNGIDPDIRSSDYGGFRYKVNLVAKGSQNL